MRLQAPVHHPTAEQVDDGGQAQPALVRLDVGDVAIPELVRASGLKRRCTRSGVTGRLWRLSVVTTNLRFVLTLMPCYCMSLRTRSLPTRRPRASSSFCMRGQPYSLLASAWMARMCASKASSLRHRAGPPWPDSRRAAGQSPSAQAKLWPPCRRRPALPWLTVAPSCPDLPWGYSIPGHHRNRLASSHLPNRLQLELPRVLRTHLLATHCSTRCRYFQQGSRTPLLRGNFTRQ